MVYMDYSSELERIFDVRQEIAALGDSFDGAYSNLPAPINNRQFLRRIRIFLSKRKDERRQLLRDTRLSSTDCLTIAVLANLLAARKGVRTKIARPDNLAKYFHAMLVYSENGRPEKVFNLSGRGGYKQYVLLTPQEVEKKLGYIKPVIDMANYIRRHK